MYDLESLDDAPALCVLSACDSGLSEVKAGDELMGLTATLLALGSATILASVVTVPDEAGTLLMTAFHRELAAGSAPAEALVHAQDGAGRRRRSHCGPSGIRMLRGGVSVELEELVHAAAAGDQAAWNTIVERFSGLIWATVRAHRLSAGDAAEVVQTTWLRLVEHLDRIREPERLGGWLATTARNECLRQIRHSAREVPSELGELESADDPALDARPRHRRARPGVLECVHGARRALPGAPPGADGRDGAELPGGLGGPRDADRGDRAHPPALPRATAPGSPARRLRPG